MSRTERDLRTPEFEGRIVESMRSVIRRELLSGTAAQFFNGMFPERMKIEFHDSKPKEQHPTSKYTPQEKNLAGCAYDMLGFCSGKPEKRVGELRSPHDLNAFRIYYSEDNTVFANRLNSLPALTDMAGVTMTDPIPNIGKDGVVKKMDRATHSKILGAAVMRDIMRMAIKTPELFLHLVDHDMAFFKRANGSISHTALGGQKNELNLRRKIAKFNEDGEKALQLKRECGQVPSNAEVALNHIDASDLTIRALASGIEYAKYITLYAYIHDSQTPAFSDLIMKSKKRFPGQKSISFSEDAELKNQLGYLVSSKIVGIDAILAQFDMDKELFLTQVESICDEDDHTLGGLLIKNKRGGNYVAKGGVKHLAGLAAFDRDQVAGTVANMEDRAKIHLPGGFKHSYKSDEGWKDPFGSFTERLQLLAYAMARNMTRDELIRELTAELRRRKFNNEDIEKKILPGIAITAEEFEYGPNFKLQELPAGGIIPTALDSGSLKRLLNSFAALTYFHYRGDQRAPYETIIQDVFTTIHGYQIDHPDSKSTYSPQLSNVLKTCVGRSDLAAISILHQEYPVIAHLLENYSQKGFRVREEELPALLDSIKTDNKHAFISHAPFFSVDQKPGTFVQDELDERHTPMPYLDIIRERKVGNTRIPNPDSLPNRLDALEEVGKKQKWYFVIAIDDKDVLALKEKLLATPETYRNLTTRALRYWMLDLQVGVNRIDNQSLRNLFPLEGEDDPNTSDKNILFLREAQEKELSDS